MNDISLNRKTETFKIYADIIDRLDSYEPMEGFIILKYLIDDLRKLQKGVIDKMKEV